jgi:ankyrin repeat protein
MTEDKRDLNKKLLKAAKKGDLKAIGDLLAKGAEIDSKNGMFDTTPLGAACGNGQTEAVKLLLERGAKPDAIAGNLGMTALYEIVNFGQAEPEIVKLLLAAGADPEATESGKTVLDRARKRKDTESIALLEAAIAERAHRKQVAAEEEAARKAAAEKLAAEAEQARQRNNIAFSHQLAGKTIEEIYNFAAKERTTFVRAAPGAPVEAVTQRSFSELADTPGLREAFEEHRRRGGTTEESAVFPDVLQKGHILPKNGAGPEGGAP